MTNADTAVLSIGMIRAAGYYANGAGSHAGNGYGGLYWHSSVWGNQNGIAYTYHANFNYLSTRVMPTGDGANVARRKPFPYLLSGSYRLAEGTGTRMDTATLTLSGIRAGYFDTDPQSRTYYDEIWTSRTYHVNFAYIFDNLSSRLSLDRGSYKGRGNVVRSWTFYAGMIISTSKKGLEVL